MTSIGAIFTASWMLFAQVPASDFASDMADGYLFPRGWAPQGGSPGEVRWLLSEDGEHGALQLNKTGPEDWLGVGTTRRFACAPGDTVSVAAWVQSGPSREPCPVLYIRFFTLDGGFVGQDGPEVPGRASQWRRIAATAVAPPRAATWDISLQIRASGDVVTITNVDAGVGVDADDLGTERPALVELMPIDGPRPQGPDADGDGLTDAVEAVLGTDPNQPDTMARESRQPSTSFQTHSGYLPEADVKTDVVIVAGNGEETIRSWAQMGYTPHVMVGFRAGQGYIDEHPGSGQTDADGRVLDCGPGSYYMVPTEDRKDYHREYFRLAVLRGAKAAGPEEAEGFARAGYSSSFKSIYEERYGEPWVDPTASVDARYRADRLKAELQYELLNACWDGARSADPKVDLYLFTHSPVNYASWSIISPHWRVVADGRINGMVGQVWTGTARTATTLRGDTRERTFENAYLEYASLVGLARDTGIDLWFLMDPLEDNPDRSMADYYGNYVRTLAASLFFPEVSKYETMPWPTRIFGRVPDEFATTICTVVGALADIQNHAEWSITPERAPIATFVADSLQWQRGDPSPSDFNGFYGLCLPFVGDGVPVSVAQLERAPEPGYLDHYKTLLLSYDAMKPLDPQINVGLADWVRAGGELLVFGGDDAYNAVDEWWTQAGYSSPQAHLMEQLGLDVGDPEASRGESVTWHEVARTDYTGRDLENLTTLALDLSQFAEEAGTVALRFEDSKKNDGWGALVRHVRVEATLQGEPVVYEFDPGTSGETPHTLLAGGAVSAPGARFADGQESFAYAFDVDPGTTVGAQVLIGNQYIVSAAGVLSKERVLQGDLFEGDLRLPNYLPLMAYPAPGRPAMRDSDGNAVMFRAGVGEGTVTYCGLPPSAFTRSPELDALLPRLLVNPPAPSVSMEVRRGPYVAARSLEAGEYRTEGLYVDLLTPDLRIERSVELGPDECVFLKDWSDLADTGSPQLIATSSHVAVQRADDDTLALLLQGPERTPGVARVFLGARTVAGIQAVDPSGREVEVSSTLEEGTLRLDYPGMPLGVALRITFD